MSAIHTYYRRINDILAETLAAEEASMERAAQALADACEEKRSIFAFGCSHAGLLALELFYRTGGLTTVNPVRIPGLMTDVTPITMSSEIERLDGYGRVIFNSLPAKPGDVILIHSVSGRNAVSIDMAQAAREKGLLVIVLTNMNTSAKVASRHSEGKKLYDFADILLDNHGDYGDAAVLLDGFPQKVAPSSTVVGGVMLNAIVARTCEILIGRGIDPPVFMSSNIDGGDDYNKKVIAERSDNIFYM